MDITEFYTSYIEKVEHVKYLGFIWDINKFHFVPDSEWVYMISIEMYINGVVVKADVSFTNCKELELVDMEDEAVFYQIDEQAAGHYSLPVNYWKQLTD